MKLGRRGFTWILGVAVASAAGCAFEATGVEAETSSEPRPEQGAAIDSQAQAASLDGAYGWAACWENSNGHSLGQSFNSSGGSVACTYTGTGMYTVTFFGLQSKIPAGSGYPMVTANGFLPTRCKIRDWRRHTNSLQVDVRCNNASGAPKDSTFYASVYDRSTRYDTGAYAVVILSTNSPAIDTPRSWTSGGAMSVERQQAGLYRVRMPGASKGEGAALVTAIQNNGNYCKVHDLIAGATDATVQVACYNATGTARVDESFVVDFIPAHGRAPGATAFIHTLSSTGATAPPKTGAYSDMEALLSAARPNAATPWASYNSAGSYTTWFPQIRSYDHTFWHVTANGTDNTFCKPSSGGDDGSTPSGTRWSVLCMNPSGVLTNARYFHYMGSDIATGPL